MWFGKNLNKTNLMHWNDAAGNTSIEPPNTTVYETYTDTHTHTKVKKWSAHTEWNGTEQENGNKKFSGV